MKGFLITTFRRYYWIFLVLFFLPYVYALAFIASVFIYKWLSKPVHYHYPTWNTVIPFATKDAVILVLRELAVMKGGDPVTARSICKKTWFDDHIIRKAWFDERACVLFDRFSFYPIHVMPKEHELYNNHPILISFDKTVHFAHISKEGIVKVKFFGEQNYTRISFHLESSIVDQSADLKIIGVFQKVLWLKRLK